MASWICFALFALFDGVGREAGGIAWLCGVKCLRSCRIHRLPLLFCRVLLLVSVDHDDDSSPMGDFCVACYATLELAM